MAAWNAEWLFCVVCGVVAGICWIRSRQNPLRLIPGPGQVPLVGNLLQVKEVASLHQTLSRWHREFGPIFKIRLLNTSTVVVSGYSALHEALVVKGTETGGRSHFFRSDYVGMRTGILTSTETDATWRALRKVGQRHLKQFGDGLSRLEGIIGEVADDMFRGFRHKATIPFDPRHAVREAAAKTISFLLSGQLPSPGDPILEQMEEYEYQFLKVASPINHPRFVMYDLMPWLRHLGLKSWREISHVAEMRNSMWEDIKCMARKYPESRSFARLLLAHCHDVANFRPEETTYPGCTFMETDAKMATTNLLLAGITTTSNTFYSLINILAHKRKVQESILDEINRVVSPGYPVRVQDKHAMPYTRALIYEVLRYTSVVPVTVSHRAVEKVRIGGYTIPKGTRVLPNLWALHHDPEFWKDPEEFRPERFLDEDGNVVPADHANRKHLMPFGAGPRVCLGESMALVRLFIWTAAMIQKFRVVPAEGNKPELIDTTSYLFNGTLSSQAYQVIFYSRQ